MDLNKVTLIGNLVRTPESTALKSGQRVTKFSLATNYSWQDAATKTKRESVDFHDVIAWGRLGEIIETYVKQGDKLYVEGRLRNRTFVGRDGAKKGKAESVADNVIMLGHRAKPQPAVQQGNAKLVREDVDMDDEERAA